MKTLFSTPANQSGSQWLGSGARKTGCVLGLAMLSLPGCFQLREPEPAGAASEWIQPTQIDILLSNFITAVQHLNVANYERSFSGPDFRFGPDPTSAGSATAVFANWSVPEETTYFTSLRRHSAAGTTNTLTLTDRRDQLYTTDSVEVSALYQLRIAQQDTAFHAGLLQGNIRLILRRRNNEWRIIAWRDQRTTPGLCWTDLKKYFISR
ncbi:MAG: hypothetical protein JWR44_468 [Hymenobacter sp.]|jgi:hypothetical protein|nr:hypothetical protein [Hymenobacter sp.]